MNSNYLDKLPIYIIFIAAPFAVSSWFQNLIPFIPTTVIITMISVSYLITYFLKKKKIQVTLLEINIILLFLIPILISFIGIIFSLFFESDTNYLQYVSSDIFGRMVLVFLNVMLLIGLLSISANWTADEIISLIKKYYYGVLFFALIGAWQFLHYSIGIPFLNLETRNQIHSVQGSEFIIGNRLTSLANEPSYFAPLIIDLIIIAFIVSKKPIMIIFFGLFLIVFSYSGGGYLNTFSVSLITIIGLVKYRSFEFKRKYLSASILFLLFISAFSFIYYQQIMELLYPFIGRLSTMFDIQQHSRLFMVLMPFIWVLEGNFLQGLFGYGPSSFNFLHLTKFLPNGTNVHVTSNNLFTDTVYELGYIGLICYITIFYKLLKVSWGSLKNNKYSLYAWVLTIHLFTSSIYRGDFMQPRFWIIIYIILILLRIGNRNKEVVSD
ncbi:hypothetical protein [Planococcus sp. CAU13]|uniref:hypothetical protein n=1 Tax=Planococcus sp. CAU13 TaxID=1541197 RepID=UPI000530089C|nr:hypothetical protein [Planococcus sp. CAU13]